MAPRDPDVSAPRPKLVVSHDNPGAWAEGLPWIKTDKGLKSTSLLNAVLMIEHHPELEGVFKYDSFRDQIRLTRALPRYEIGTYPREMVDHDETALAAWLNIVGLSPTIATTASAIRKVAFAHQVDPLQEWLSSLVWDRRSRIDNWLTYYAGADKTNYTSIVGRKFLVGAVARVLDPGCKNDTMMVLEGPQGILKSSMVRDLCGEEWFSDQIGDITNKDSSQLIQGRWMIEVPEMDKFSRQETNAVKDFLSRREDRYRPPYGRNVITRPRRGVFVGTINPTGVGYLKDPTGGRRFWPVKVTAIDLSAIQDARSQLWAEAVHLYRQREIWWITEADELAEFVIQQADRLDDDVWEPKVLMWARTASLQFTSADALKDALNIEPARQGHREKLRIANILQAAGYENRPIRDGHGVQRMWTKNRQDELL